MKNLLRFENLVSFDVFMKFGERGDASFINHASIEVGNSNSFFILRVCLVQSK